MKSTFKGNLFALTLILFLTSFKFIFGDVILSLNLPNMVANIITSLLVYLIPVILYFLFTAQNAKDTLRINNPGIINIILVIIISIFLQPLLMLISGISTLIFPNNVSIVLQKYSQTSFWQLLIMSAVIPAIMEEICFRGIIFSNYRNVSFKKAALATGFIFGMAHMDGQQFLYAFFMGIVFAYFVYKTGSIFTSMVSHFTINGVQTYLAYLIFKNPSFSTAASEEVTLESLVSTAKLFLFSLPTVIILFIVFKKINSNKNLICYEADLDFLPSDTEEKVFNLPLVIFIIFFMSSLIGLWK